MTGLVTFLAGGGTALGGVLLGRFLPARRGPRPVEARCGCGHHHSFHDPATGQCHGTDRRILYSSGGADLGYRDVPCTCRQYTGPQPLPEYFAPEITS